MDHLKSFGALCFAALTAAAVPAYAMQDSQVDVITDARARAASEAFNSSYSDYRVDNSIITTYTREIMHDLIENNRHLIVVKDIDKCQFTPDIENRARLLGISSFEFAWGDMLITGTCVRKDEALGLEYFQRAVEHGYAPAFMKIASFYEQGYLLEKDDEKALLYMRTAAAMGSRQARLAFADMMVRGFATEASYETAYRWLYHTKFTDPDMIAKKQETQAAMEKIMPMNIAARARASSGM